LIGGEHWRRRRSVERVRFVDDVRAVVLVVLARLEQEALITRILQEVLHLVVVLLEIRVYVASEDVQEELAADDGVLVVARAERLGPELDDAVSRRSRDARELEVEVAVSRGIILRRGA